MILHIYPVVDPERVLIRIESGAILDKWFEFFAGDIIDFDNVSYPIGSKLNDKTCEILWQEQMNLMPHPYRLTVCDDLQEFASSCV